MGRASSAWGFETSSVKRPKCAVKHSSTRMVEEALAYVQGESLKANAALLTEAFKLPDHQSGGKMAFGSNRPAGGRGPEKRGCLLKLVLGLIGFPLVFFVIGVVGLKINRHFETPQERAEEDRQDAQREMARHAEQQQKDAADAKASWVSLSRAFAEVRMQKALKDPDSGQFRDISIEDDARFNPKYPGIACGYVNAKNSFGGYTGFKGFMVVAGVPLIEDGSGAFARLWNKHCRKNQL